MNRPVVPSVSLQPASGSGGEHGDFGALKRLRDAHRVARAESDAAERKIGRRHR